MTAAAAAKTPASEAIIFSAPEVDAVGAAALEADIDMDELMVLVSFGKRRTGKTYTALEADETALLMSDKADEAEDSASLVCRTISTFV